MTNKTNKKRKTVSKGRALGRINSAGIINISSILNTILDIEKMADEDFKKHVIILCKSTIERYKQEYPNILNK